MLTQVCEIEKLDNVSNRNDNIICDSKKKQKTII